MDILDTQIDLTDERFIANEQHNRALALELREHLAMFLAHRRLPNC